MSSSTTKQPDLRAPGGVLLVACLSTFVVNANTSAVTILLPSIAKDVHASVSTLQWAVTGYSLVGAAFIVTSGALGDVFGRRKIFLGGLVLFALSCALIALAGNQFGVIAGRAIQGAAGSTLLASGLSLLSIASTGVERIRAVSIWGAATAAGSAAGPLVGGLLVNSAGWQSLFWIDAAIALLCIPLSLRTLQESHDPNRPRSIDWIGTFLVATILAPLILAVSKGSEWGWGSTGVLSCLAISIASIIAFAVVEQRLSAPLIDLSLLKNKVLIGSTVGLLLAAGAINGLSFAVSLYFQDKHGLGMSPLQAGLATLPGTVVLMGTASLVPKWATKLGTRNLIALGFTLTAVGYGAIGFATASWKYIAFVLPFSVGALGAAMSNGPCSSVSTSSVPDEEVGAASGISNMARYVGASLFTAVAAAIYGAASGGKAAGAATGAELASGFAHVGLAMGVLSVFGIPLALTVGRHKAATAAKPTSIDVAAAAASHVHTIPAAQINAQCR